MGKGDLRRPSRVEQLTFDREWERIFRPGALPLSGPPIHDGTAADEAGAEEECDRE